MGWQGHRAYFKYYCEFLIFYLTFNDLPSGIFSSQVIDVVKFLQNNFDQKIKLVSFISLRGFLKNRRTIKNELSDAIVLPMFPRLSNWRLNQHTLRILCFLFQPKKIIARSVLATHLAFLTKNKETKVVYDGRGAIAAEWKEYGVVKDDILLNEIVELERQAILKSDFRIAVSSQLLKYWQTEYKYEGQNHVVIPCTLNPVFEQQNITDEIILNARKNLGYEKDDIVFVYSGSLAGWQSFDLLYQFIQPILKKSSKNKLLFLSGKDKNIDRIKTEFSSQVNNFSVSVNEVPKVLVAADYGLMIRQQSITNRVASPVKFAEYLACGLEVVLSEQLGDYSRFVEENNCGLIYSKIGELTVKSLEDRIRIRGTAIFNYSKSAYVSNYSILFKSIVNSIHD